MDRGDGLESRVRLNRYERWVRLDRYGRYDSSNRLNNFDGPSESLLKENVCL